MVADSADIRVNSHSKGNFERITDVDESTRNQRLRVISFPDRVGCRSSASSRKIGHCQVACSNDRRTKLGKHVVMNRQVIECHIARVLEHQSKRHVKVLTVGDHIAG